MTHLEHGFEQRKRGAQQRGARSIFSDGRDAAELRMSARKRALERNPRPPAATRNPQRFPREAARNRLEPAAARGGPRARRRRLLLLRLLQHNG